MSDLSEISPIDPSTANVFNPIDPANPQNRIPISVEDVIAYFELAKNKFGIKADEDLTKIFNKFVESNPQIHPLALGNVNRTHNLIRLLAKRLLKSHKTTMSEEEIGKVVETFTEKLYSHTYFIGRKEAKEGLGLKSVVYADDNLSQLLTQLYEKYSEEMELGKQWNPEDELGPNNQSVRKDFKVAFVESSNSPKYYGITMEFRRQQSMVQQQTPQGMVQIPQEQVGFRILNQGWK